MKRQCLLLMLYTFFECDRISKRGGFTALLGVGLCAQRVARMFPELHVSVFTAGTSTRPRVCRMQLSSHSPAIPRSPAVHKSFMHKRESKHIPQLIWLGFVGVRIF